MSVAAIAAAGNINTAVVYVENAFSDESSHPESGKERLHRLL